MVQTIIKAHGGVPIAIGIKVETKEGEGLSAEASAQAGSMFVIQCRKKINLMFPGRHTIF